MSQVCITVVLPTRNIAAYLPHALASIASQAGPWRLVAVDSASTDGTRELLAAFAAEHGERVLVIDAPTAKLSEAVNLGIAAAEPGWIQWIGGDDRVAPGGHAKIRALLATNPDATWICGAIQFRAADGSLGNVGEAVGWNREAMLATNRLFAPSNVFTREIAIRAGLFSPVLRRTMDYEFWFRLAWLSQPIVTQDVLADFTLRNDAISGGLAHAAVLREKLAIQQHYSFFTPKEQLAVVRTFAGRYLPALAKHHLRPWVLKVRRKR